MKRKEKAEFDSIVIRISGSAKKAFEKAGYEDAEDLAQDVALRLSATRLRLPKGELNRSEIEQDGLSIFQQVAKEAHSRKRGLKLMDIESAISVPDVSTPYHFAIASEIASTAISLDLDSVLMGDTMEDEAEHYGVTRQRAHQITNEKRDQMLEFLVD